MRSDRENLGISVGSFSETNPPVRLHEGFGATRQTRRGRRHQGGRRSDERHGAIPTRQASCPTIWESCAIDSGSTAGEGGIENMRFCETNRIGLSGKTGNKLLRGNLMRSGRGEKPIRFVWNGNAPSRRRGEYEVGDRKRQPVGGPFDPTQGRRRLPLQGARGDSSLAACTCL